MQPLVNVIFASGKMVCFFLQDSAQGFDSHLRPGQIGYRLEDGSRLNQRQFDHLADNQYNEYAPRMLDLVS